MISFIQRIEEKHMYEFNLCRYCNIWYGKNINFLETLNIAFMQFSLNSVFAMQKNM